MPVESNPRRVNRIAAEFFVTPRINVVPASALGLSGGELAGIRPEQLEVADAGASGAREAVGEQTELTGAEVWASLRAGHEPVAGRAPARFAPGRGPPLSLRSG